MKAAAAAVVALAVTALVALGAQAEPPTPAPTPPPPPPPPQVDIDEVARRADAAAAAADRAIADAEKKAAKAEKLQKKHRGISIRLNGSNIQVQDNDGDEKDGAENDADAKDAEKAADEKGDADESHHGDDDDDDVGSTGGDGDVIANLPPDVRERLTGEQIESILRRQADRHTESVAATLAPAMFFLTVIAVVIAVIMGRHRRDRILHETLRAMIEKGVEIPEPLLLGGKKPGSDRRRGLIVGLSGVGLTLCLLATNGLEDGAWAIGLVPILIGVGYFVAWYLDERRGADGFGGRR